MANLDGTDDVFDSRDVVERLEEIETWIEELKSEIGDNSHPDDYVSEREDLDDLAQEREALESLRDEFDTRDFEDGITLISEADFENYARELAEDIGAYDPDAGWPNGYIDWERAARDLRIDYTAVEFHGVTYWGRA